MSRSKFTPGPWVINRDESTSSCDSDKVSIEGGSLYIAQVDHCMHQEANAKLIAAAPCLLAALVSARDDLKSILPMCPGDYIEKAIASADAIIRKATA